MTDDLTKYEAMAERLREPDFIVVADAIAELVAMVRETKHALEYVEAYSDRLEERAEAAERELADIKWAINYLLGAE